MRIMPYRCLSKSSRSIMDKFERGDVSLTSWNTPIPPGPSKRMTIMGIANLAKLSSLESVECEHAQWDAEDTANEWHDETPLGCC